MLSNEARREEVAFSMAEGEEDMSLVKRVRRADLLVFISSSVSSSPSFLRTTVFSNSVAASSPINSLNASTLPRNPFISAKGLKPHRPSKSVTAIAISGLWLSSG